MKLYKIESSNFKTFFGSLFGDDGSLTDPIERDARIIAQTPNCDAFLFLSNTTYDDNVELLDTAPSGFDFTYCQEWGLAVNDAVVDRVIADLS
tara:strand:+ start:190 stop:468 length:279 start_codon:yes stop_codon:yes gene_type:complete